MEQGAAPRAESLSLSGDPATTRKHARTLPSVVTQAFRCLEALSSLGRVCGRWCKCPPNWVFTQLQQSPCKLRCPLFTQGI